MLEVQNIRKNFSGFQALNGASLRVERGQIVAVIGPNGAGKSTLFNVITGHLRPDEGRVLFQGRDITGLPAHRICHLGISRSFQLINIFYRLSVFENVQVSVLSRQGLTRRLFTPASRLVQRETMEILEKVGLADKRHVPCASLSYGDQKVLEMAIALGNKPLILLLDEPTAGMSPEETRATIKLIKELAAAEGLTILFTEHDIEMVFDISESIMVLHQGQTIVQAAPEEVRRHPEVQKAYLGETV